MRLYCYFFVILSLFLLLAQQIFPVSPPFQGKKDQPWFTGPLLSPSSRVVPKGKALLEPYYYRLIHTGRYDNNWNTVSERTFYQTIFQLIYKFGIWEDVNLTGSLQSVYNKTEGVRGYAFQDLPIGLDFQLYKGKDTFLRLGLVEIFPTGKYHHLDPDLKKTDAGGNGAYTTQVGLTLGHLIQFSSVHFLSLRLNVSVSQPSSVAVKGLSVHGGDIETRGKVYPGTGLNIFSGLEYSITKNWAFALDVVGQLKAKSRFKGHSKSDMRQPSSVLISIAPALEYNWNEDTGFIMGSWFSVAGKNAKHFHGIVAAFNLFL